MNLLKKINILNIRSKEDFFELVKQFFKFGIVGVSNTAISLGIYYLFYAINEDLYVWGNSIGFFVSVLNAYYWNQKYVFDHDGEGHARPLIKSFIVYGATFGLNTVLLIVMAESFGVPKSIAPVINLIVTIPLNFLLNKFWAFKN